MIREDTEQDRSGTTWPPLHHEDKERGQTTWTSFTRLQKEQTHRMRYTRQLVTRAREVEKNLRKTWTEWIIMISPAPSATTIRVTLSRIVNTKLLLQGCLEADSTRLLYFAAPKWTAKMKKYMCVRQNRHWAKMAKNITVFPFLKNSAHG